MKRLRSWLIREEGVSEAATAIFVLPIIVALIFLLVETGFNIRTRTIIDNTLQDTTRSVAHDGGYNNPRSTTLPASYTAGVGSQTGWAKVGSMRLQADCTAGLIRSVNACNTLTVTCTPAIAATAGSTVSCSLGSPITYKTLSPLSTNPLFSFGFGPLFTTPISETITSVAALGASG